MSIENNIIELGKRAKNASLNMKVCSSNQKNLALTKLTKNLDKNRSKILEANKIDLENGEKKSLQQISEETGLSYQTLIQRFTKNKRISYKKLTEPSLLEKVKINGEELLPKEFREKYKLTSQKYYKALKNGFTHKDIVENIDEIKKDKRKKFNN